MSTPAGLTAALSDPSAAVAHADTLELSLLHYALVTGLLPDLPAATASAVEARYAAEVAPVVRAERASGQGPRAVQDHVWLDDVAAHPGRLSAEEHARLGAFVVDQLSSSARSWDASARQARAAEQAELAERISGTPSIVAGVGIASAVTVAASAIAVQMTGSLAPNLLALPTIVVLGTYLSDKVERHAPGLVSRLRDVSAGLSGTVQQASARPRAQVLAEMNDAQLRHPDVRRVVTGRRAASVEPAAGTLSV